MPEAGSVAQKCKNDAETKKNREVSKALFVGARLAGEGVLKSAFAGKPGSYEKHCGKVA